MWEGKVECGICESRFDTQVEIFDDQEIDEPMIPLECINCGCMTCHPYIDPEAESDEVWGIGGDDDDDEEEVW